MNKTIGQLAINSFDMEYLRRPALTDVAFEITNDSVCVTSPCTQYIRQQRIVDKLEKKALLKLYSAVRNRAKNKGVCVSTKKHYKKFITENWDAYKNEINYYNEVFNQLIKAFKTVELRGLHRGTTDDIILEKAYDIKFEYEKVFHRDSAYRQVNEINKSLVDLLKDFDSSGEDGELMKIYL